MPRKRVESELIEKVREQLREKLSEPIGDLDERDLKALERLRTVGELIDRRRDVDDQAVDVANSTVDDYREELRAFRVAVARQRAGRLHKLVRFLDAAQDYLATPEVFHAASLDQKIEIMRLLDRQMREDLDLVRTAGELPNIRLQLIDKRQQSVNLALGEKSAQALSQPRSREAVRNFLEHLLQQALPIQEETEKDDG